MELLRVWAALSLRQAFALLAGKHTVVLTLTLNPFPVLMSSCFNPNPDPFPVLMSTSIVDLFFNRYVTYGKHSVIRNDRVVNSFDHTSCSEEGGCRGGWMGEVWNPEFNKRDDHRWVVSARADTEVEVVEFDIEKFHTVIRNSHPMLLAADKMQIDDVWGKLAGAGKLHAKKQKESKATIEALTSQLKHHNIKQYTAMVALAAADGEISKEEVQVCNEFRELNEISDIDHADAVKACGYAGTFALQSSSNA